MPTEADLLEPYAEADARLTWILTEDLAQRDFDEFEAREAYMNEVYRAGGRITL